MLTARHCKGKNVTIAQNSAPGAGRQPGIQRDWEQTAPRLAALPRRRRPTCTGRTPGLTTQRLSGSSGDSGKHGRLLITAGRAASSGRAAHSCSAAAAATAGPSAWPAPRPGLGAAQAPWLAHALHAAHTGPCTSSQLAALAVVVVVVVVHGREAVGGLHSNKTAASPGTI